MFALQGDMDEASALAKAKELSRKALISGQNGSSGPGRFVEESPSKGRLAKTRRYGRGWCPYGTRLYMSFDAVSLWCTVSMLISNC